MPISLTTSSVSPVRLGITLPNMMPQGLTTGLLCDWARVSEAAGFSTLGVIDKPSDDTWDPLVTLAAAAVVTRSIRLATTILHLPNRNEVLVAKQAAVVDHLSEGRLVLGLGQGGNRPADYEVYGASLTRRGEQFSAQIDRIREVWSAASASTLERPLPGPAPFQAGGPPIWVGARVERAVARALRQGDGFIFTALSAAEMAERTPDLRRRAALEGKPEFPIVGLAYVAVGEPVSALKERALAHLESHYERPRRDLAHLLRCGPVEVVAEEVRRYEQAGLDELVLIPQIPELSQVERLAELVPPAYR